MAAVLLAGSSSVAADRLKDLPAPLKSFAAELAAECRSGGLGELTLSEHYRDQFPGMPDVNGDGRPDHIAYRCMFGCAAKPKAFEGLATPCAWGNLLLSEGNAYKAIFMPGLLSHIERGPPIRIAVGKPRALQINNNFCLDGYPASSQRQVFELKDGRFQLAGMCPESGCKGLLEQLAAMSGP